MPNLLSLISESWEFLRRQQAITHVGFWFLFLPTLVAGLLADAEMREAAILETMPELKALLGLAYLSLSLVVIWGTVCILNIGKRLLQAKAGRTRTSFKAVRVQSAKVYIPFLLTSILRVIFTLLWAVLLIVPGIVYFIRTVFAPVIVVCEGLAYRPALNRSKEVTEGKFWDVFLTIIGLSLLTLIPAQIFAGICTAIAKNAPPAIILAADTASGIILTLALIVYLLSLILAYGYFRPRTEPASN
jgi:uncharacterized membrane protein